MMPAFIIYVFFCQVLTEYPFCDLLQFPPLLCVIVGPVPVIDPLYHLMFKQSVPVTVKIYLPDTGNLQPGFLIPFRIELYHLQPVG